MKQNKREVLAAVLSGKIAPKDIPGQGVVIVSPGTPGTLDVNGVAMSEKEAVRAINRAETAIFFEGHEECDTALLDKVAGQVDWVIDFNNDLNEVDNG
jgi:hypothetical protein